MEYSNDEILNINRNHNQILYKFYKMFAWDLLFYYSISFLFLNQIKGLSTSQIIFADAFYPIFKLLFQFPATILVEKIGKRKALTLANLSISTYILFVLFLSSQFMYIISNIFCALGFVIKGIAETNMLYDSIENSDEKRKIFSKIDGKGNAMYFYLDAITASTTGFLYVFNPYLPLIISLSITILSAILAYNFREIHTTDTKTKTLKDELIFYIKDLKQALRFIIKSNRLMSLIIFYALFSTLLTICVTLRRSLLTELNVPNEYFGILFAIWGLVAGFSANGSSRIHRKYKNRTLTTLGITYTISILLAGLFAISTTIPLSLVYFNVFLMITIQHVIKGPYYTLIQRYLGSFSNSSLQTKISSASMLIENLTCTIITFFISYLTSIETTSISFIIIGILFTIVLALVLYYMKSRVGLRPEQYPKSDIEFKC